MARIVGDGYDEAARARIEAILSELAERLLALGLDVVLDFGFWSRAERDAMRERARAVGAACQVCFLDAPQDEIAARLTARNADLPADTFEVTGEQVAAWRPAFQPPDPDELD
jgi:predicted kinase